MLVNSASQANALVVALLSNDDSLAHIVRSAVEMPWRLERHFYSGEAGDFLQLVNGQVRRNLHEATLLYVAGVHSVENERRARGNGANYYTAKPIQSDELTGVLKGFMSRVNK
jgi:hypothetical protein